jgi:hypothetical protein
MDARGRGKSSTDRANGRRVTVFSVVGCSRAQRITAR